MKNIANTAVSLWIVSAACGFAKAQPVIVDFEDVALPGGGVLAADGASTTIFSRGAGFNAAWNEDFDCCPGAWAISNHTDTTTAGFMNPYSAITGSGFGSPQYGVAFVDAFAPFGFYDTTITLPDGIRPDSMRVTNTTYTFLAIRDGDDGPFGGFVRQFETGDYFKLTISGYDEFDASTGIVDFFLADYRSADSADHYVVGDWRLVDLTPLADATRRLDFTMETTDVHPIFGPNTPFYFAADDLVLSAVAVPEPSSLLMAAVGLLALAAWRWVRAGGLRA